MQKNNKDEIKRLHDLIQKKKKDLRKVQKIIDEEKELEHPNDKTEQNKPKFTSKEIRDFIKSRGNVSDTDRMMLEKVVELANQFPDESL